MADFDGLRRGRLHGHQHLPASDKVAERFLEMRKGSGHACAHCRIGTDSNVGVEVGTSSRLTGVRTSKQLTSASDHDDEERQISSHRGHRSRQDGVGEHPVPPAVVVAAVLYALPPVPC
jgi:hypothetical protein